MNKVIIKWKMGEKIVSFTNGVDKIGYPPAKYIIFPLSYTIHRKWINDLNLRPEAVKFPEENIVEKIHHIAHE